MNANTEEDRRLGGDHLRGVAAHHDGDLDVLVVETVQSHVRIAVATRTRVAVGGRPTDGARRAVPGPVEPDRRLEEVAVGNVIGV